MMNIISLILNSEILCSAAVDSTMTQDWFNPIRKQIIQSRFAKRSAKRFIENIDSKERTVTQLTFIIFKRHKMTNKNQNIRF